MERGGLMAFLYLGAKHMVTGYDHLLFLFGVIFFLYRMRDVGLYVTLFAVGHSVTLLYGVLSGTHVDAYLLDAVIGFSVVYKALDNLGAFRRWFGVQPDTKAAVFAFGLIHGFGLATNFDEGFAFGTSTNISSPFGLPYEDDPNVRFRRSTTLPPTVPAAPPGE